MRLHDIYKEDVLFRAPLEIFFLDRNFLKEENRYLSGAGSGQPPVVTSEEELAAVGKMVLQNWRNSTDKQNLEKKVARKPQGKLSRGVLLLQEKAPVHKSQRSLAAIQECGFISISNHA